MSHRVTRSAARQAAESPNPPAVAQASSSSATPPTRVQPSRKRKASSSLDRTSTSKLDGSETTPPRRNKRVKLTVPDFPAAEPSSVGRRGKGGKKRKMSTSEYVGSA
jgi:E3 ubiquitin-protein ligase TRIP12